MFRNLSIKLRIITTLAFLVVLIASVGFLGWHFNGKTTGMLKEVSLVDAQSDSSIAKIERGMESSRSLILLALQHHPGFEFSKLHDHPVDVHLKAVEKNVADIKQSWAQYESSIKSPEEKTYAEAWFQKSGAFGGKNALAAVAAIKAGNWDGAEAILLKEIAQDYRAGASAASDLSAYLAKRIQANNVRVENDILLAGYVMLGAILAGILFSVMCGISLIRSIMQPLDTAVQAARRVASGDLTGTIEVTSTNEVGQLLIALKEMTGNLAQICAQVRSGTSTIATATAQIAAGNQDLSSRTEEQASSLEETASSMEQLTSTVRQNGDNANQANQLAISASDIAVKGGAVVSEVVHTMGSINESSRKIVDIISVIDGIAFQTNILALNAAVEAARAGEQGRGFAVVASEVRNLAQRSASAAKEIKVLIDDSVEKVATGSKLVDQAGATMDEIVTSIRRVTDIMSEITAATREQVDGIEQINQAVTDMDSVTQQNAALVEEAAAAAEALQQQAGSLMQVVSRFHTGEAMAAPAPALAAPAREAPAKLAPRVAAKKPAAPPGLPARAAAAMAGPRGEEWALF